MEEETRKSHAIRLGVIAATVLGSCAAIAAVALNGGANAPFAEGVKAAPAGATVHCASGYSTNLDWNISHEEVLSYVSEVPVDGSYKDFSITDPSTISPIIESITASNGFFYRQESGKVGYLSWKFGSTKKAGSITITLTEEVDAVGLYAVAYANSKDVGKCLTVNGIATSAGLIAAEPYDGSSDGQRFFVELDEPSSEVTISARDASPNRFYLYSIGFYFA